MTIIDDRQAYQFMSRICLLDAGLETFSINTHEIRVVIQHNLDHLIKEYDLDKDVWKLTLIFNNPQNLETTVKQGVFANSYLLADPDPDQDMAEFDHEEFNVEKVGQLYRTKLEWGYGSISFDYQTLNIEVF